MSDQAQKLLWYLINRPIFNFSGPESISKGPKSALENIADICRGLFVSFSCITMFIEVVNDMELLPKHCMLSVFMLAVYMTSNETFCNL